MESLLSLSFDNVSSKDTNKIRKGLRGLDRLLAQICLSQSLQLSPVKRRTSVTPMKGSRGLPGGDFKSLDSLQDDPAYAEFYKLQQSFEWNVATRLVECLERLLGMGSSESTDQLIASAQETLLGVLLLHPPSKCLFSRELHMNLLLDLLDPANGTEILMASLLVLVAALLDQPRNVRTFESADGLQTVCYLHKSLSVQTNVKTRVSEVICFYLMPETTDSKPGSRLQHERSPSKATTTSSGTGFSCLSTSNTWTRSVKEKESLLGQYLNSVGDIVRDMKNNTLSLHMR